MEKIRLKGGSLSGTYHVIDAGTSYVRKEISLVHNREYGYQRWYSQLKRMQRYSIIFPDFFPKILRFGCDKDTGWFDMNYIEDSVNFHQHICHAATTDLLDEALQKMMAIFDSMHQTKIASANDALRLYLKEEVERPLSICLENRTFREFQGYKTIVFNGDEVTPLAHCLDDYLSLGMKLYTDPGETFTHGNSTLENMLYVPSRKRLYFIDPYEETIVDSVFGEFSQVLQSSNSYYELYDLHVPIVDGNKVHIDIPRNRNLDYFNEAFLALLRKRYAEKEMHLITIFEISQFIRMLPFKMAIAPEKMIFYYGLGSALFSKMQKQL